MADLKIAEWIELANSSIFGEVEQLPEFVKVPESQRVATAFANNCQRLRRLPHLLTAVFEAGKRAQNQIEISRAKGMGVHPAFMPPQFGSRPPMPSGLAFEPVTVRGAYLPLDSTAVHSMLENLGDTAATDALGLLMSMQVTAAWTAIESLAGDLWEQALNVRPKILARLEGLPASRISERAGDRKGSSSQKDKNIDPKVLLNYTGSDLSLKGVMGTMYREEELVAFSRLSAIRVAYSRAFGEHSANVDAALGNQSLDALAALRNCLVHKAGRADGEYDEKAAYLTVLPKVPIGSPIPLDGQLVGAVIVPALSCGKELVEAVDGWLGAHP